MKPDTYDFRQFQKDLAALDQANPVQQERPAAPVAASAHDRLLQAQAEFAVLRKRYRLTVAHVITFFPEDEGVAYLQQLIEEQEGTPRRRRRSFRSCDESAITDR